VNAAQGAKAIRASAPADKVTLLRRATLDLTGLPPTPEEVQAFLTDNAPDAFAKVVDGLLASPQYGERPVAGRGRYADTNGFKADEARPNIWRYRDYVVKAFNEDKPYDRFIREQIAGDEVYPESIEAHIATGFLRHIGRDQPAQHGTPPRGTAAEHHGHGFDGVHGPHLRLREVPQPQVQSDSAEGLLPGSGVL
jgi:hypothetical protein